MGGADGVWDSLGLRAGLSGSRRGAPPLACVAGGTIANGETGRA